MPNTNELVELVELVTNNNVNEILSILNSLPSDNERLALLNNPHGTPFMLAASLGRTNLLKAMLNTLTDEKSKHVVTTAVSMNNRTALDFALQEGHFETVKVILDNMPDYKHLSSSSLKLALQEGLVLQQGHFEIVKIILDNIPDDERLSSSDLKRLFIRGLTSDNAKYLTSVLKLLPSDEERLKLINDNSYNDGNTPFIICSFHGKTELLEAMLNSLTDEKSKHIVINNVNNNNITAFSYAIFQENMQTTQFLTNQLILSIEAKHSQQEDITKIADQLREHIKESTLNTTQTKEQNKEKIKNLIQDDQSVHRAGNIDAATKQAHSMLQGIYNKPKTDAESRQVLQEILNKIAELKQQSQTKGYNGPSKKALDSAQKGIERMLSNYVSSNTRQLIALAWTAASDKSKLIDPDGSKIAPETLSSNLQETILIQMHEAQNTYGFDSPSCIPGTENRVMTALSQYYPNINYTYGIQKETEFQDISQVQAKYIAEGKLFTAISGKSIEERIDMFKKYKNGYGINDQDSAWKDAFNDAEMQMWNDDINYRPALFELMANHEYTSINPLRCLLPEFDLSKELNEFIKAKYANSPSLPENLISEFLEYRHGLTPSPAANLITDDIIKKAFIFIDKDQLAEAHKNIQLKHVASFIEELTYAELKFFKENNALLQEKWAAYNANLNLPNHEWAPEDLKNSVSEPYNKKHANLINDLRQDIEKIALEFKNKSIIDKERMAEKISNTVQEKYADLLPDSAKQQSTIKNIMQQPCEDYLTTRNTTTLWQSILRLFGIDKQLEVQKTSFAEKISSSFADKELVRRNEANTNPSPER